MNDNYYYILKHICTTEHASNDWDISTGYRYFFTLLCHRCHIGWEVEYDEYDVINLINEVRANNLSFLRREYEKIKKERGFMELLC